MRRKHVRGIEFLPTGGYACLSLAYPVNAHDRCM